MVKDAKTEYRSEQHFVAIHGKVHMSDVPRLLPPLIPEVYTWLNTNNIPANGWAFFHYKAIDDQGVLDVAVGVLVNTLVTGDGHIEGGFLPAGRYAVISFMGDYINMKDGHMALERWIQENGFKEQQQKTNGRISWGGRTEFYITDPETEPDVEKWQTDIAFLLEN